MDAQALPLKNKPFTWVMYIGLVCVLSWVCFGSLRHHLLNTHDDEIFRDNIAISEDFRFFFSPQKEQLTGRPVAELVKWIAYTIGGNDPGWFHLVVVGLHTLASLLLAWVCRRMGMNLELSLLGGLLFLVNVAHFQGVHCIAAMDYPLALVWGLLGVLCYLHCGPAPRPGPLACLFVSLGLGVLSHLATAAVFPFYLYWSWHQGHGLRATLRRVLPLGFVLGLLVLLIFRLTEQVTTTWITLDRYLEEDLAALLAGFCRMFLWLVGRLFTTAHWLPLPVYELQTWELYWGGVVLAGLLVLIWKKVFPLSVWGAWSLLFLLPFLMVSEEITVHVPEGPSRYLYLATAGSSLLVAWAAQRTGMWLIRRFQHWGIYLYAGGVVALLGSSYAALKQVEAISFYTSGRYYLAHGDMESGIERLQRAIAQSREAIPLEETYFRLAIAIPYTGADPEPVLREAMALFPDSFWLNSAMAVIEMESVDSGTQKRGQRRFEETRERAVRTRRSEIFTQNMLAIYHNLGTGYFRKGDPIRAIRTYRRAMEFDPDKEKTVQGLSDAYVLLGIQLGEQEKIGEAIVAYRQALEMNPTLISARVNLGWSLYLQGQWEEAIDQYLSALEREPCSHAQFNLGLTYLAMGDIASARAAYALGLRQFGREEARKMGAIDDLEDLIEKGIQVEAASQILQSMGIGNH